jgi:hypothetical protein
MDIAELQVIEAEEAVAFSLGGNGKIRVKGKNSAVDRALGRIAGHRDEVAVLLRERGSVEEEDVVREVASNIPSLEIQRANYVRFYMGKSTYYHPSPEELDKMFSVLEEGDEVLPDFAHSFTVRKPDGRLVMVDRRGRVNPPSAYSPAVQQKRGDV